MHLDGIEMLIAFFASIAGVADRFVVILKSFIPPLADPNDPVRLEYYAQGERRELSERARRLWVHLISFVGGSLAAWAWAEQPFHWGSNVVLSLDTATVQEISPIVAGVFGVAGGAFWSGVVGYVTAAKDLKKKIAVSQSTDGAAAGLAGDRSK